MSTIEIMKIISFLLFSVGLATPYAAAVPAPEPASAPDISYPTDIFVKYYPKGLPPRLYPRDELTSRSRNVEKRVEPIRKVEIDAPGVNGQKVGVVGVYACSDKNFGGFCVYVRSFPGQCGE